MNSGRPLFLLPQATVFEVCAADPVSSDSLKSTAHSMEPASPTKAAASKKKSAASPMKRPSMAKMGRLLSFSKRGEKRSTAALVVEEAVSLGVAALPYY